MTFFHAFKAARNTFKIPPSLFLQGPRAGRIVILSSCTVLAFQPGEKHEGDDLDLEGSNVAKPFQLDLVQSISLATSSNLTLQAIVNRENIKTIQTILLYF